MCKYSDMKKSTSSSQLCTCVDVHNTRSIKNCAWRKVDVYW